MRTCVGEDDGLAVVVAHGRKCVTGSVTPSHRMPLPALEPVFR